MQKGMTDFFHVTSDCRKRRHILTIVIAVSEVLEQGENWELACRGNLCASAQNTELLGWRWTDEGTEKKW